MVVGTLEYSNNTKKSFMDYKAKPIYSKDNDKIIATKVNKSRLEEDFDGYYEAMLKLLNADVLKIEDYDDEKVVMYDKERFSRKIG